jgi:hypothetical protein
MPPEVERTGSGFSRRVRSDCSRAADAAPIHATCVCLSVPEKADRVAPLLGGSHRGASGVRQNHEERDEQRIDSLEEFTRTRELVSGTSGFTGIANNRRGHE